MFNSASAFNQNISSWNTAAVTNMSAMFSSAGAFNQPIGSWNTAAVTNMSSMFAFTTTFNQALSFNTSAVTTMSFMFYFATAFNQPLSFNTGAVTNMSFMFSGATAFNQNLGALNVALVTNFSDFMAGKTPATFSTTNLDAIYNGWVTVQSSRTISFGTAKYSAAGTAGRAYLTGTKLWTITDGGL
jgi:surface protein